MNLLRHNYFALNLKWLCTIFEASVPSANINGQLNMGRKLPANTQEHMRANERQHNKPEKNRIETTTKKQRSRTQTTETRRKMDVYNIIQKSFKLSSMCMEKS